MLNKAKSFLCVQWLLASSLCAFAQGGHHEPVDTTLLLHEVEVVGNDPLRHSQMGAVMLHGIEIERQPQLLGEPDVLRVLRNEPGVSEGVEGLSGLLVRGGESDQNLFLLHHLPLYQVSHLSGLFSAFNVAVVERVQFLKAGFPAVYGGRLSGICDVTMRESDFNSYHAQATEGTLAGNVLLTGPVIKDRLAVTVSFRRSWAEFLTEKVLDKVNSLKTDGEGDKQGNYYFMDTNLKLDYRITNRLKGYTHFYYGTDRMSMGSENTFQGQDGVNTYAETDRMRLRWGNRGAATGLSYSPRTGLYMEMDAYVTDYMSQFRLDNDQEDNPGHAFSHKTNDNGITDIGFSAQGSLDMGQAVVFRAGAGLVHHRYRPEWLNISTNMQEDNVIQEPLAPDVHANEVYAWIHNTFTLTKGLQVSLGLRGVDYTSLHCSHTMLEPRVGACWQANEKMSIKGSYMRTNQFEQQVSNSFISLSTDAWLPIGESWDPLQCDQWSVGIYGKIPADCHVSVEGYYKSMRGLLEYRDGLGVFTVNGTWDNKVTQGDGRAYGCDVSLYREKGRLTGSIAYGLMWNTRQFDLLNDGKRFPAKYDNRHKLNINLQYKLSDLWEAFLGWTYISGNRLTLALENFERLDNAGFGTDIAPIGLPPAKWGSNFYTSRNNVRLPDYHRLDVGVSFHQHYRNGWQGTWNVSLYNAYNHVNPVTITKEAKDIEQGDIPWTTRYKTYGLLPIIPSLSYTLKI